MSNLKEYVVVKTPDDKFEIWSKKQYDEYIAGCVESGAGSAYRIVTHFNEDENLLKDSPYQGSAGVWRKASNGKPKVKGLYITRRPTLEGANWIYADVTYNPKYGDTYIDQWENFGLEWLDDSAATPAGDGWNATAEQLPPKNELVLVVRENGYMLCKDWEPHTNQDEAWFREHFTHWRPLPSPPNKSV